MLCPRISSLPMNFTAVVHSAEEGGFWAEVPALPGCFTQGETLDELRANLAEATTGWLEAGELAPKNLASSAR